jgi:outer membrane protein OmpA-like peptidoglycan-associated protein
LHERLSAHPGFVLASIESKPWRSLTVRGLLDPDADPLAPVLEGAGLGDVAMQLETSGYVSTANGALMRRAQRLLAPPNGIRISAASRVLRVEGRAPAAWLDRARERAGWVPGVAEVAFDVQAEAGADPLAQPAALARRELDEQLSGIGALHVAFGEDLQPVADAMVVVDRYAHALRRARDLAVTAGVDLVAIASGTTDASGGESINARLRAQRAHWLADALRSRGIDGIEVEVATPVAGSPDRRGAQLRVRVAAGRR